MNKLLCWIPIILLCSSARGQTPDPAKMANIEEIFRLTNADQMLQAIFAQLRTMTTAQLDKLPGRPKDSAEMREIQEQVLARLTDGLSWARMKPKYIALYDETFSTQEIAGVLEFYKSPAGAAMLAKMPLLMTKSIGLGQALMADTLPDLQRIIEEVRAKHKGDPVNPSHP